AAASEHAEDAVIADPLGGRLLRVGRGRAAYVRPRRLVLPMVAGRRLPLILGHGQSPLRRLQSYTAGSVRERRFFVRNFSALFLHADDRRASSEASWRAAETRHPPPLASLGSRS